MSDRTYPLFLLGCAPLFLGAQTTERGDAAIELEPFVVTAWALPFSIGSFAGSTEVLTHADWDAAGIQSLAEALEVGANVNFHSFSGNGAQAEIDLRGYGENSGLRTLILVDGQPLNRADMGAASWLEAPLARVARVEVLRGPQTARFGNFAVGGVINIITRLDPEAGAETELETGAGSYGSIWGRAHHSRPLGGGAVSVATELTATDGYRANSGYAAQSASLNYGISWAGGAALRTGLFILDDRLEFPGPLTTSDGSFPTHPRRSGYGEFAKDYFSDNRKVDASFALTLPLPSELQRFEVRGGVADRELGWNFGTGSHAENHQFAWRLTPEWRWEETGGTEGGLGLHAEGTRLGVDQYDDRARTKLRSEARLHMNSAAVFAYGEHPLPCALSVLAAVRGEVHTLAGRADDVARPEDPRLNFDRAKTSRGFAAQLGLNWKPGGGIRSWLRYDHLYRFPVTDEVAYYQGFPSNRPFNDSLYPEIGDNLELGAEWEGAFGGVNLNAFVQRLKGEISYDYRENLNVNLADTRRLGLELSAHARWHEWTGRVAYTRLSAVSTGGAYDGRFLPLVSPHSLSASLDTPGWRGVQGRVEVLYRHKAFEGNDFLNTKRPLPGWTAVNCALRWEANRHVTAFLRLNNLFDREYATLKFLGSWYPAPGRNVRAGVRVSF